MGWFKIAVVSAIGVYSARSVYRVNQLVKQVSVPNHSLLDKYSQVPNFLQTCFNSICHIYQLSIVMKSS